MWAMMPRLKMWPASWKMGPEGSLSRRAFESTDRVRRPFNRYGAHPINSESAVTITPTVLPLLRGAWTPALSMWLSAFLLALPSLALPSLARADALVVVEIRGASTRGRVELKSAAGSVLSCVTENHRCRLDGVPGGRYQVSFHGADGESHRAQPAMIPPNGTVTLVIPVS